MPDKKGRGKQQPERSLDCIDEDEVLEGGTRQHRQLKTFSI